MCLIPEAVVHFFQIQKSMVITYTTTATIVAKLVTANGNVYLKCSL